MSSITRKHQIQFCILTVLFAGQMMLTEHSNAKHPEPSATADAGLITTNRPLPKDFKIWANWLHHVDGGYAVLLPVGAKVDFNETTTKVSNEEIGQHVDVRFHPNDSAIQVLQEITGQDQWSTRTKQDHLGGIECHFVSTVRDDLLSHVWTFDTNSGADVPHKKWTVNWL